MATSKRNGESAEREMTTEEKYYMDEIEKISARPFKGVAILPAKLKDYLFLGGYGQANSIPCLKKRGITHVLNCVSGRNKKKNPYPSSSGIVGFAEFPGEDRDGYDILANFDMSSKFINCAREAGGTVFVHCAVGVNRSATICIAYLMEVEHLHLLEVMELMKKQRGTVPSNRYFRLQLVKFAQARGLLKPPE